MKRLSPLALLCLTVLPPPAARAGRPLFTDDATLTDARACQLETWWQGAETASQYSVLPACNPFGNLEVTAGRTTLNLDGTGRTQSYLVQGKTVLKPLVNGGYGVGLAAGVIRPDRSPGNTLYAYVPFSVTSATGVTSAHLNLGWQRDDDQGQTTGRAFWGLGVEHAWTGRVSTFAEVVGGGGNRANLHAGVSYGLIPDRLQLDATYGRATKGGSNGAFYSAGLNIYLPPF